MRRTVRGLMAAIIPLATAWRARSGLLQCVMCKPCARGSKQAKATICARCKGGNALRAARSWLLRQQLCQSALFVATTDTPDCGDMALRLAGYGLDAFSSSDGQHDTGV